MTDLTEDLTTTWLDGSMSLRRCRFPSRSYARWPAEVEIRTLKPTRSLNTTNFREAAEFAYSLNEAAANCYYALNPVTSGRLLASHTVTRGRHKGRVTLTIATALNQRLTRNTDEVETVQ